MVDGMVGKQSESKAAADQRERPIVSFAAARHLAFDTAILKESLDEIVELASGTPDILLARKILDAQRGVICEPVILRHRDQHLLAKQRHVVKPRICFPLGLAIDRNANLIAQQLLLELWRGSVDNLQFEGLLMA